MDENEQKIDDVIEDIDGDEPDAEDTEVEAQKPEPKAKAKETPEAKKARLERELKRVNKDLGVNEEKPPFKPKSGELDETQLDYLDLKGITEDDDIEVIQKIVRQTGMTIRQVLKDDYVVMKLDANRAQRAVKEAMPGNTKRGGGGDVDSIAIALAKFEASGELPTDFKLRSEVVNMLENKSNSNKPAWQ